MGPRITLAAVFMVVTGAAFGQTGPAPNPSDAARPAMHIGNGHRQPAASELDRLEKGKAINRAAGAHAPSNAKAIDELCRQIMKSSAPGR